MILLKVWMDDFKFAIKVLQLPHTKCLNREHITFCRREMLTFWYNMITYSGFFFLISNVPHPSLPIKAQFNVVWEICDLLSIF